MSQSIELEVIASNRMVIKTSIREIYIPAFYGEAGILENHLPYISLLNCGEIAYKDIQGLNHYLFVQNGFVKNEKNKIVIISDLIEKEEDMDRKETEERHQEMNKKIQSASRGGITAEELEQALEEQKILKIKVDILKKSQKK